MSLAHLTWPPTRENTAAWEAACTTSGGGDLGADHGPSEPIVAERDGDWIADAEEDRLWRRWP